MDPPAVYGCISLIIEIIALPLILILIFLQFLFHLVAGSPNNQIKNITNWLIDFLKETFEYLTYKTEQKPFPFDQDDEGESNDDIEEVIAESTDNSIPEEESNATNKGKTGEENGQTEEVQEFISSLLKSVDNRSLK